MMQPKNKLHATADRPARARHPHPRPPGGPEARRRAGRRLPGLHQGRALGRSGLHDPSDAARRGPLGQAVSQTLEILLQLLPRRGWAGRPMLRVTNATLASHVGCSDRQVQRHLARLHEHGVIDIHWGHAHARLRFDVDAAAARPRIRSASTCARPWSSCTSRPGSSGQSRPPSRISSTSRRRRRRRSGRPRCADPCHGPAGAGALRRHAAADRAAAG